MLDAEAVEAEMERARAGLATQLEAFTHNSTEFLRREQDLLLHGRGVPRLATRIAGRPVVVVVHGTRAPTPSWPAIRAFLREQDPVLVGVGARRRPAQAGGLRADIVVLDAHATDTDLPAAKTLRAARDVVVRTDRGAGRAATSSRSSGSGIRPVLFESAAAPEDAALVLADAADAAVIVARRHARARSTSSSTASARRWPAPS